MKRTTFFSLLVLVWPCLVFWTPLSLAHGLPRSVHGGYTATQLDLGFEIFLRGKEIVVYVSDHDSPFSTDVFTGYVEMDRKIIALKPAPGGLMVGVATAKRADLSRAMLTLKAEVLAVPLKVNFIPAAR